MTQSNKPWILRAKTYRSIVVVAVWTLGCTAALSQDIVVGQSAPFSGPQAVSGLAIRAGVNLYLDSVNANGGVHGRRIRLVSKDDEQKPPETVRLIKEMIAQDKPVALLCTVSTGNLEALISDGVLGQNKLSMVGPVSGAASVVKSPNMFVVKASYHDEVARLFKEISSLGQIHVAVLYQEDSFGQDVLAGADAAAKLYGVKLEARASYARNTLAVEKAVATIVAAKPQVVFVGATTAAAIEFVKQYKAAKGTGTLYGMSFVDSDAMLKSLGPDDVRGYAFSVVLPLHQQTERAIVREYQQLRVASADKNLSVRSMEGFIAAKTLVKVLESVPNPTPATVTAALMRAKLDLGDYSVDFTERERTGSNYVDFAMFGSGGKVVK